MVSAIILHSKSTPSDGENLSRVIEALHFAQVFDIALIHEGNDQNLIDKLKTLEVKRVQTTVGNELSAIASGIAACDPKDLHGVIVVYSDQRTISQGIIVELLHQFWIFHKPIVISRMETNQDIHIFADTLFKEIRKSSAGETIEAFVTRHVDEVLRVQFDEHGTMVQQKASVAWQQRIDDHL